MKFRVWISNFAEVTYHILPILLAAANATFVAAIILSGVMQSPAR